MNRQFIRSLLVEKSFAYGFTVAFWGTGLLLINEYGLQHTLGILEYAGGAVTGFGLLAVVTFGGAVDTVDFDTTPQYFVLAGIHYLSGLLPIVIAHLLVAAPLGKSTTLVVAAISVSLFYNLFAALEEVISEGVWTVERRYGRR